MMDDGGLGLGGRPSRQVVKERVPRISLSSAQEQRGGRRDGPPPGETAYSGGGSGLSSARRVRVRSGWRPNSVTFGLRLP